MTNTKRPIQISAKLANPPVVRVSPKKTVATNICTVGDKYCKNPIKLKGSPLAPTPKNRRGAAVTGAARTSQRSCLEFPPRKIPVPSQCQNKRKPMATGQMSVVSRVNPAIESMPIFLRAKPYSPKLNISPNPNQGIFPKSMP